MLPLVTEILWAWVQRTSLFTSSSRSQIGKMIEWANPRPGCGPHGSWAGPYKSWGLPPSGEGWGQLSYNTYLQSQLLPVHGKGWAHLTLVLGRRVTLPWGSGQLFCYIVQQGAGPYIPVPGKSIYNLNLVNFCYLGLNASSAGENNSCICNCVPTKCSHCFLQTLFLSLLTSYLLSLCSLQLSDLMLFRSKYKGWYNVWYQMPLIYLV